MTILLAEDEPDVQLIARLSLKKAGFTVVTAGNGVEALERVAAERPDVILLDWMMPDMDGFETCRRLKADPATAGIPVIFLTARVQEAEVARAMALGAAGCIGKPFDALTLGQRVLEFVAG
ncbi:MAG TPA: response regulator [Vicinamibacterales bacterium]|nr:response regulator [Vicinamibacterales bacterium]HOG29006.1 response regulator [Vicinamibacterales bacterium]HOQ60785.1 response regulator [Vicinamibacterales bacterium]HPK71451.1 response regulator [Vicinamibacterales bacterium]HPW20656.1 response regulator [Vicinamibacterales bacterium]